MENPDLVTERLSHQITCEGRKDKVEVTMSVPLSQVSLHTFRIIPMYKTFLTLAQHSIYDQPVRLTKRVKNSLCNHVMSCSCCWKWPTRHCTKGTVPGSMM